MFTINSSTAVARDLFVCIVAYSLYTIILLNAPTSSYDDNEVDEFNRELQSPVDQTPKQDFLGLPGDWNAEFRDDAQEDCG